MWTCELPLDVYLSYLLNDRSSFEADSVNAVELLLRKDTHISIHLRKLVTLGNVDSFGQETTIIRGYRHETAIRSNG